ncbi:hypothetical protein ACO0LL_21755 [Undibacterium sp. TC4M20W]|uniref:hypothetical protein n=1 Tax=unclassified Undibacterium TaxID=2630295 RepID=UPI003BF18B3B
MLVNIDIHPGSKEDGSQINLKIPVTTQISTTDINVSKRGNPKNKHSSTSDEVLAWHVLLKQGRGQAALDVTRISAMEEMHANGEFAELVRSRPLLMLLRLQRWDELFQEPVAQGRRGIAAILYFFARGVAFARMGNLACATDAMKRLEPIASTIAGSHAKDEPLDKTMCNLALVTREQLRAEVALAEGKTEAALRHQKSASIFAEYLEHAQPPILADNSMLALANMQMRVQLWPDAEQTYHKYLTQHPACGWALQGLIHVATAQGREAEVKKLKLDLSRSWSEADASLLNQA